ncbi:MAG: 1,4-dihydroxy-2-naphthoate polyprenyltransferase [Verrucomicrobia bacterium]|nr:1,4-dihydroxy-2-naphthoate polyprenyltransferase [Verrucomicrobiota bacterium]
MHALKIWTLAARPKTLIISQCPVLIGTTLAIHHGFFSAPLFFFTLLSALCIQIGTNFANDYFDFLKGADTKERKGPLRVMQAGLVKQRTMRWAIACAFFLAVLTGIPLLLVGGIPFALLLALSITLGILYTGGPYPLAYLGISELFVFLFFGPIAVAGTYYLQAGSLTLESLCIGIAPGALAMLPLIINNTRDIEEDRKARKWTLPARFGKLFGNWEYTVSLMLSFLPLLFCYREHPFSLLALLILLPAIPLVKSLFQNKNSKELNFLFGKTGQLLALFTLLFCIGWML